jgi:peptide/nickel transport system ATP-binding protein
MNQIIPTDGHLLRVTDLTVNFKLPRKKPFAKQSLVNAVSGVTFGIKRGTTFGLVGESGCGKTTTGFAVIRLIHNNGGRIELGDLDITDLTENELRNIRHRMQIIFQDPFSSLNPRLRAGAIVRRSMDLMNIKAPNERDPYVADLFRKVGLSSQQLALFPHQFSGGQRQRIGIARALASQPDLIVCDEPVSALDMAIQAQVLNLLRKLQKEFSLTYLFISHDLAVIQHICDEIAVMHLGRIVEQADRISLFENPRHPYTLALLSAAPSIDPKVKIASKRVRLEGDVPSPIDVPPGCNFASRCQFAEKICYSETPTLREIETNHYVACYMVSPDG